MGERHGIAAMLGLCVFVTIIPVAISHRCIDEPEFEKGQSGIRTEVLNYNINQLKDFCSRIKFLNQNYQQNWDIKDQLILDENICASRDEAFQYMDAETWNTNLPAVKISGILPIGFRTAKNRSSELKSLRSSNLLDHCFLIEEYIMHYQILWQAWQQLALDYSVCLGSRFYQRESEKRIVDIVETIRTNNTHELDYEDNDIIYVHNSYVPRTDFENYNDIKLNFFCNRAIYLYDNYKKEWEIMNQLEIDLLGCWMITYTRSSEGFVRVNFSSPTTISPPKIIVKSELLFEQNSNRAATLKALGPARLKIHCNGTTALLKQYMAFWDSFEKMSDDANYCNLYIDDYLFLDDKQTKEMKQLPQRIYQLNLDGALSTCKALGLIFLEHWRQDPNNFHIIRSLKTCFWKLTPTVLCASTDRTDQTFERDAHDLSLTVTEYHWETFRNLTASEVIKRCTSQISQMRHLYLSPTEQRTLSNNLAICIHAFSTNITNIQPLNSDFYYTAGNKIISMQNNLPYCNDTLATVIKIIFPFTMLDEMYHRRSTNKLNEFRDIFEAEWAKKKLNKFYFTSACNLSNYSNNSICNTLSRITNNSSVPEFCSMVTKSIKNDLGAQQPPLKIIKKLQDCLVITLCPGINCSNLEYKRSTMVNHSKADLINSILHTDWGRENTTTIRKVIKIFNASFNDEILIQSGRGSTLHSKSDWNFNDYQPTTISPQQIVVDTDDNIQPVIANNDKTASFGSSTKALPDQLVPPYDDFDKKNPMSVGENSDETTNDDNRSNNPLAGLAIVTGLLAGLPAGLATFVSTASGAGGAIAGVLSVSGISSAIPRQPKLPKQKPKNRKTKRKRRRHSNENDSEESNESDSEENDSEEENTTPFPEISTTDLPFSSTSEATSTTPSPAELCWLEPLYNLTSNVTSHSKNRTRRAPREERIMKESDYPHFPIGLCRLNINELNSFHVSKNSYEFIELIKQCKKKGVQGPISKETMNRYVALVIDGLSQSIVFGSSLGNAQATKVGKYTYVTIGPAGSDGVTLPFNDAGVHFVSQNPQDVIPNGHEVANMLLLLYVQSKTLRSTIMPSQGKPIKVDQTIEQLLTHHKQDCLVYGSSAFKDKCTLFERICSEMNYRSLEYILRDWELDNEDDSFQDLSLSRCVPHIYPMDVWEFKLSNPTPGKENDCRSGVRFVLSENQDLLPLRDNEGISSQSTTNPVPHCSSTIPIRRVQALDAETFRTGVKRKMDTVTRDCMEGDLSNSRLSSFLTELNEFDNMILSEHKKQALWFEAGCRPEIRTHLQIHMADKVDLNVCDDTRVGWWLDLKPDEDLQSYKFTCKICQQFYKDVTARTPDILKMTKLMSPSGYLDTSKLASTVNTNTIYAHSKSLIHLDAADYVRDKSMGNKYTKLEQAMRINIPPRERLTRDTENIFYQAMHHVIHGYPVVHFREELIFNKNIYHVDVGHSYASPDGFKKIVRSVSTDYFLDLIDEIKKGNPFSLILDTYKDFSGRNMLAVSIMLFYKNTIQNKFLCLLPLGSSHTAQAQHDTLMEFVRSAPGNIEEVFLSSLAYLAADGASSNAGKFNSIMTRLREVTGRRIGFQHCSSHRLHLVFTQILKSSRFLHASEVIRSVGDIYSFFDTRSNRLARLIEIQKRDFPDKIPLTPHKPHPIRWANSMRQGFLRIYALYVPIVTTMTEYKQDTRSVNAAQRMKAEKLLDLMLTRDYLTWLSFLSDVMDVMAGFSLYSQQKTGVIVDQLELRQNLRKEISKLLTDPGENIKKFLESVTCKSKVKGQCTLEEFEKFGESFHGIKLDGIGSNLEDTKLCKLRPAYIQMILEEIDKQFHESFFMYAIMNPRNMFIPTDISRQFTEDQSRDAPRTFDYGKRQFMLILENLGKADRGDLYNVWRNVVWNIVTDANFPQIREMEPSAFWLAMLSRPSLPWSEDLKWIVKATLIIPTSSAEVERLFSSVTFLLGKYKFRTSIDLLSDYLRLRSELPRPINEWVAYPHVLKFVERKNALSKPSKITPTTKIQEPDLLEDDEDEEIVCDDPRDCFWS